MFPIIDVQSHANAHARGLAYGRAAAARVAHSVATYARLFAGCGIAWSEAARRAARHLPVIEALDPSLADELRGIAKGSGQTLEAILALNCRTEILPASYLAESAAHDPASAAAAFDANRGAGLQDWSECTAMCVTGSASADGAAWFAQNWDWIGRQRAALVILKTCDAGGRRITTLTEAGMLAKIGLNDAGFALGLNIVRSLQDGAHSGIPVHGLLRHLLSCASVAEARERLRTLASLRFGSSSNVPCADASGEIACFEVAPAGWAELKPTNGTVVHTNHFQCETLLAQQAPVGAAISSTSRLDTAAAHAARSRVGLVEMQAFLRDESDGYLSICRSPNPAWPIESRMESVAGVIMRPLSRQIWIAPDVPSRAAFAELPAA
ncbi:MAG TPA: C45 family peptidase [Burkholderiaceae bacterium]